MVQIDPVDKSLKILARRHPKSFLDLIFDYDYEYMLEVVENPVLNIPEKRADYIYILQKNLERFALHMDFQLIPTKEFLRRLFLYNALFTETLNMPVCSVAIYPEKGNYATFPEEYRVDIKGDLWNSFTFRAIKLWDYRERIEGGEFPALAPLLVLLEKNPDEHTLEREKRLINTIEDESLKSDLTAIAITIASRKFTREFLYTFFKEEINMLKEWDIVQEWIKEGEEKGLHEGIEKGIEKGRKEGELSSARTLITELLEDKFSMDKEMIEILEKIENMKLLNIIFRRSLRAKNLQEVKGYAKELL